MEEGKERKERKRRKKKKKKKRKGTHDICGVWKRKFSEKKKTLKSERKLDLFFN